MTTADPITRLRAAAGRAGPSSDFDLNLAARTKGLRLRPAAVLVAFQAGPDPRLFLTKRSSRLKHHPGQIAFPGGKIDPGDRDEVDAALREAQEEVGLPRGLVEVLGTMPPHETVTGFSVTPVLGWIRDDFLPVSEAGEVGEIFTVPFSHVADPRNFLIESRYLRGARRQFYTVPYGPYYIWGATARILRSLAEGLQA